MKIDAECNVLVEQDGTPEPLDVARIVANPLPLRRCMDLGPQPGAACPPADLSV